MRYSVPESELQSFINARATGCKAICWRPASIYMSPQHIRIYQGHTQYLAQLETTIFF